MKQTGATSPRPKNQKLKIPDKKGKNYSRKLEQLAILKNHRNHDCLYFCLLFCLFNFSMLFYFQPRTGSLKNTWNNVQSKRVKYSSTQKTKNKHVLSKKFFRHKYFEHPYFKIPYDSIDRQTKIMGAKISKK